MANLSRSGSRSKAVRDIAQQCANADCVDRLLRSVYRYRSEIEEIVRTPEFMLNDLTTLGYVEGDCDDISTLVSSITKAMGYPTRLTAIAAEGPEEFDHVFSEVQNNGQWIPVDLTVPQGTTYWCYKIMSEVV
jgi:transglutaminase-like putative cysteine protease